MSSCKKPTCKIVTWGKMMKKREDNLFRSWWRDSLSLSLSLYLSLSLSLFLCVCILVQHMYLLLRHMAALLLLTIPINTHEACRSVTYHKSQDLSGNWQWSSLKYTPTNIYYCVSHPRKICASREREALPKLNSKMHCCWNILYLIKKMVHDSSCLLTKRDCLCVYVCVCVC